MELKEFLIKIGKELNKEKIPYMIIGGQAVLIYGEPRLTRDIDITVGIEPENFEILLKIIKRIGLKPLTKNIENFIKDTFVLPTSHINCDIRVDFIFSTSLYEREALKRVKKVKFGNVFLKFASVEDLIIHKIIAGRARDLEDIKSIVLKNPNFDRNYIKKWLKEFELITENGLIKRFESVLNNIK